MSRRGVPSALYGFIVDPPGEWAEEAACAGRAPLFDPPSSLADKGAGLEARLAEAVAVCKVCPVLRECRRWTEATPRAQVSGVFAGVFFPVVRKGDPGYSARRTVFPAAAQSVA